MPTRRIDWVFFTSLLVACLSCGLAPATASGQSYAEIVHRNGCTKISNAASDAMNHHQWESLVSLARQFVGNCLDLSRDSKPEAELLNEIAIGLDEQGKFDEAIPVLTRCVTVKPDAAYCFAELGAAFEGLGRLVDARKAFERALSIGGYDQMNADAIKFARRLLERIPLAEEPRQPETPSANEPPPSTEAKKFGSGFVVSNQGHILTNNHVVAGCKTLATRDGKPLQVLSRNVSSDLALLRADFVPSSVAVFRTGPAPKLGDSVVAFGFPLPGLLSSEGNVSAGILSATSGVQNDVRFIQISAPVQPGNSGGPLFDSSGHVIGVVVAKLDAVKVAEITGDVPQNVNFAVNWVEVRAFLDDAGVPYKKEISQHASTTASIAEVASRIAVPIECTSDGTESSQSQESRSQGGQAAGPSLQDTISWMQDFSQADGIRMVDGRITARNVLVYSPADGCTVLLVRFYPNAENDSKPGTLDNTSSRLRISLSDIAPESVKPDSHGNVELQSTDPSGKIVEVNGLVGGGEFERFISTAFIVFDSTESAQRFANALKHAVEICGGVKSPF